MGTLGKLKIDQQWIEVVQGKPKFVYFTFSNRFILSHDYKNMLNKIFFYLFDIAAHRDFKMSGEKNVQRINFAALDSG